MLATEVDVGRIDALYGERLTQREREVLRYLLEGLSHKRIAEALGRTSPTIVETIQRIHKKLDTRTLVDLGAFAHSQGLIRFFEV